MIEITEEEYELFQKLKKILIHANPEKSGAYFICGEVGAKDELGLPKSVLICPHSGLEGFALYEKTKEYSAPAW